MLKAYITASVDGWIFSYIECSILNIMRSVCSKFVSFIRHRHTFILCFTNFEGARYLRQRSHLSSLTLSLWDIKVNIFPPRSLPSSAEFCRPKFGINASLTLPFIRHLRCCRCCRLPPMASALRLLAIHQWASHQNGKLAMPSASWLTSSRTIHQRFIPQWLSTNFINRTTSFECTSETTSDKIQIGYTSRSRGVRKHSTKTKSSPTKEEKEEWFMANKPRKGVMPRSAGPR